MNYADVIYPTTLSENDILHYPYPTVDKVGCGLCCICMVVEMLTGIILPVKQCVVLSVKVGANFNGTDMKILSKAICKKYDIIVKYSNKKDELRQCLTTGGCAIINVGKAKGVFSEGGHFLTAVHVEKKMIWLLDPSFTEEKYLAKNRRGKVLLQGKYILADIDIIEEECMNRIPSFYLFWNN